MDEAEYCDRLALIYRGELIASGTPNTLKTEVMRETVLDVITDRPHEAMSEVETLAGVSEVALFGAGFHAVVSDPALSGPIRQGLVERGYRVERVEPIVPSLEDVFVSLIEARDRRDAKQSEVRQ
jgi:ABC-2 type transport system ATP-binding protein